VSARLAGEDEHLYADPHVYQVLHAPGTSGEIRVFERIVRRELGGDGPWRWLELASGSGRYLIELARRGHRGVGIDLSEEMTAYARAWAERVGFGGRAEFRAGRMERFRVRPAVDVAFCPINSFRHLGSDRAVRAHFGCVRAALRRGGVYLLGIDLHDPVLAQPSEDVWSGRERGLRVDQFVSYVPPAAGSRSRRELVISHLTITRRGAAGAGRGATAGVTHRDSRYALRTYTLKQWRELLRAVGWRVRAVCNGDGVPVAVKPVGYQLWVLSPED
jgi:SAM-dependent methyltransferase